MPTIRIHICQPCNDLDGAIWCLPRAEIARRHRVAATLRRRARRMARPRRHNRAEFRRLTRIIKASNAWWAAQDPWDLNDPNCPF